MKLRNKKTGKIQICDMVVITDEQIDAEIASLNKHTFIFRSVEQFNDEYEAYKHKKPKLDGEVREIVRHWASLHGYHYVKVGFIERNAQTIFHVVSPDANKRIEFLGAYVADDFEVGDYSIEELCGEEEE